MNERGFVLMALIVWMPFFLMIAFGLTWTIWFLNQVKAMENICHQGTLKAQEALVEGNRRVMALNPRALRLYGEKKALKLLILTGPPPVKAAAKLRKKKLVASQKLLQKQQKLLFYEMNFKAQRALFSLRRKMGERLRKIRAFWKSSQGAMEGIRVHPSSSQLKVRLRDIAPIYKRGIHHWKAQGISVRWWIPLKGMFPPWLSQYVPIQGRWKGQCFSHPHLKKGGSLWRAAMGKGNHL